MIYMLKTTGSTGWLSDTFCKLHVHRCQAAPLHSRSSHHCCWLTTSFSARHGLNKASLASSIWLQQTLRWRGTPMMPLVLLCGSSVWIVCFWALQSVGSSTNAIWRWIGTIKRGCTNSSHFLHIWSPTAWTLCIQVHSCWCGIMACAWLLCNANTIVP